MIIWYKKNKQTKTKKVAMSADNSSVNLELLQLENMINQEEKSWFESSVVLDGHLVDFILSSSFLSREMSVSVGSN